MSSLRKRPEKSLRSILIIWFALISILPLALVTGYSLLKFRQAVNAELVQRLLSNAREFESAINEHLQSMKDKRRNIFALPSIDYLLSGGDPATLRVYARQWLKNDATTGMSFFSRKGVLIISFFRDRNGEIREFLPDSSAISLTKEVFKKLDSKNELAHLDYSAPQKLRLIFTSKVANKSGANVGFVEQSFELDQQYLQRFKKRTNLELFAMSSEGLVAIALQPELASSHLDFRSALKNSKLETIDIQLRGAPLSILVHPTNWGEASFYLGLGAYRADSQAILRNINFAFFGVVGAIVLVLIGVIIFISSLVIKPVEDLVEAVLAMRTADRPVHIPFRNKTEIGLLTESFNEMSRSVISARDDLKKKILELESANKDIKNAQAQLVHSSKMSSLGQLVAGVAHELNNPIGFIYSNMTLLRDYSERLFKLISELERRQAVDSEVLNQLKREIDFDYLQKDLKKLIQSCEDGSRRTREIVLGLRNFSRIDESVVKEINLVESIENTLQLLSGEIKNRIVIHRDYQPELQSLKIHCYASELNQVFMNLLANSAQAIPDKGDIWIRVGLGRLGGMPSAVVEVQDNGQGIASEHLDRIFDPFFTTKKVGEGTGLGLSITYGIIQKHRGQISVQSEIGVGTKFSIELPLRQT
jgi:two-component system NtrC family sensor kinase